MVVTVTSLVQSLVEAEAASLDVASAAYGLTVKVAGPTADALAGVSELEAATTLVAKPVPVDPQTPVEFALSYGNGAPLPVADEEPL